MSSERPILFSGEMIRAILEGRKTQTRRVIKPQPEFDGGFPIWWPQCPYGKKGDRLWVREAFSVCDHPQGPVCSYKADHPQDEYLKWRPSIHMPRCASRITLEIINIRIEQLQEISDSDALAEGVPVNESAISVPLSGEFDEKETIPRALYRDLWDSINAKRGFGWDVNPWVWVIEFKRLQKNS